MGKLIGYVRVSTRQQNADRQVPDLLAAGVRRDDLYIDSGVSGGRTSRPAFDKAVAALEKGDTLVIATLGRLGRSTQNMLNFAEALRGRGAGLRVLNLGGGDVDTATRWARWSLPTWPAGPRWSWRSSGSGPPTRWPNARLPARTSAGADRPSPTRRSATPSGSSRVGSQPPRRLVISGCHGPPSTDGSASFRSTRRGVGKLQTCCRVISVLLQGLVGRLPRCGSSAPPQVNRIVAVLPVVSWPKCR